MIKRASIEFVEVTSPIRQPVTKFGGQPVWLSVPEWPISRKTGQPMQFICQVALDADLFGKIKGRMAYLFITDGPEYVEGTWEPDSGENAVIIQPGDPLAPVQKLAEGPTLNRLMPRRSRRRSSPRPCEFAVRLIGAEDPEFVAEQDRFQWEEAVFMKYCEAVAGNKVGGTAGFIQGDNFPGDDFRQLILQLDSTRVPFHLEFGDGGVGYAFLSRAGRSAKFLWQCS